jgi:hypothetical protein
MSCEETTFHPLGEEEQVSNFSILSVKSSQIRSSVVKKSLKTPHQLRIPG